MLFFFAFSFVAQNSFAKGHGDSTAMKDCCMMKGGKMMCMKEGKMMPMEKSMKMKNGTTCMPNGDCIMKDGKKMKMKDGQCMDMNGKMDNCGVIEKKHSKTETAALYSCPMHPDVHSDKPGKCPKCQMDLEKK